MAPLRATQTSEISISPRSEGGLWSEGEGAVGDMGWDQEEAGEEVDWSSRRETAQQVLIGCEDMVLIGPEEMVLVVRTWFRAITAPEGFLRTSAQFRLTSQAAQIGALPSNTNTPQASSPSALEDKAAPT